MVEKCSTHGETTSAYTILAGKPVGKILLKTMLVHRSEYNI